MNQLLNTHTALAELQSRHSLLLAAPAQVNATRFALATAAALAAGHRSPSPIDRGWMPPILCVSFEQTTAALSAELRDLASYFGAAQDDSLIVVGTDRLLQEGFPDIKRPGNLNAAQSAIRAIVGRTKAKLVVLDAPADFYVTATLALGCRQVGAAIIGTTNWLLDRPGCSGFQAETSLIADEEGSVTLQFNRPFQGFARPVGLPGLLREPAKA